MLPAANRLRRSPEFAATLRRGPTASRSAGSRLVVHVRLPGAGQEPGGSAGGAAPLVGFIVPRAVGPAVVRNRVRRRLRHLAREHVDRLPAGSRLVVRALPAAAGATFTMLRAELATAVAAALPSAAGPFSAAAGTAGPSSAAAHRTRRRRPGSGGHPAAESEP